MTPEFLERMRRDLKPVRPRPSTGALTVATHNQSPKKQVAIAATGVATLGAYGWHRLTPSAGGPIFAALLGAALLTASATVAAMIPGSKRMVHPAVLAGAVCVILPAVFAAVAPAIAADAGGAAAVSTAPTAVTNAAPGAVRASVPPKRCSISARIFVLARDSRCFTASSEMPRRSATCFAELPSR